VGHFANTGLTACYYKQVTADSGSGATFGDFKAKTVGCRRVLSYVDKVGGKNLIAALK
jgi:hypothetical protein